jgi:hypothetical protein
MPSMLSWDGVGLVLEFRYCEAAPQKNLDDLLCFFL